MQRTSCLRRHARSLLAAVMLLACAYEAAADTYSGGQLHSPLASIGAGQYSNVGTTVSGIVKIGSGTGTGVEDLYNPTDSELTIPSVSVGSTGYTNVIVTVRTLVSIGSVSGVDTYSGGELHIPRSRWAAQSTTMSSSPSAASLTPAAGCR